MHMLTEGESISDIYEAYGLIKQTVCSLWLSKLLQYDMINNEYESG